MEYIRNVDDFKIFLNNHHDEILSQIINIENLPEDDEWVLDDEWDGIYESEAVQRRNNCICKM